MVKKNMTPEQYELYDEYSREDRNDADDGLDEFVKDNLKDLIEEFLEGNDDFREFCKTALNQFKEDSYG